MVISFLMIEARRYRYYDLRIRRVRLIEDGYWAPLLRREPVDPDAIRELAHEMAEPRIQLSLMSAVGTRINRTYGPILLVLTMTWFVKVHSHPKLATNWRQFFENAGVGPVAGGLVFVGMVLFLVGFVLIYALALVARPPLGELRSRPRSHRGPVWHQFLRPYGISKPRRRRPAT